MKKMKVNVVLRVQYRDDERFFAGEESWNALPEVGDTLDFPITANAMVLRIHHRWKGSNSVFSTPSRRPVVFCEVVTDRPGHQKEKDLESMSPYNLASLADWHEGT